MIGEPIRRVTGGNRGESVILKWCRATHARALRRMRGEGRDEARRIGVKGAHIIVLRRIGFGAPGDRAIGARQFSEVQRRILQWLRERREA